MINDHYLELNFESVKNLYEYWVHHTTQLCECCQHKPDRYNFDNDVCGQCITDINHNQFIWTGEVK